jgi:sugar-specific transcriptional regulator TrmB
MWEELVRAGLDPKEAKFYIAVLEMARPTVSDVAAQAGISRTNAYDVARRLARRGLLSITETGGSTSGQARGKTVLAACDPGHLLDELQERKDLLEGLVPQLRAVLVKTGAKPRVRYLEGAAGIRTALFETLEWTSPLRGILSMRDVLSVPGDSAMRDYIAGRRERGLKLRVVRSEEHDSDAGWPSSEEDLRETRFAPAEYPFTMTSIIGTDAVVLISSRKEGFALIIESYEYTQAQSNLFEVLWSVSTPG